jgi:hypothetical protein
MTNTAELAKPLADAQRSATSPVDPAPYAALDRAGAYAVHFAVNEMLGERVGMLKTAVHPDGVGAAAGIYTSRVGHSPSFRLPSATIVGLEVEVGLVLARDVKSSADIPGAIDHYFLGVEICGTRVTDRAKLGTIGGLADAMSAYGYCIGPRRKDDAIDGLQVRLEFGGKEIYAAPAKHGFGNVLASLRAYADAQQPSLPLKAGTIVTMGSMCGLVPTSGPGHVVAYLGDESVSFDLI